MTVIAFDGRTLAADRQSTFFGTAVRARKAHKATGPDGRRFLYGCGGDSGQCYQFTRWVRGFRKEMSLSDFEVLMVDDELTIWAANHELNWHPINSPFWAIGAGREFAMGAMAAGKSAREAVLITNKLCNTCGLGVDVVRF